MTNSDYINATTLKALNADYTGWLEQHIASGYEPFYINFMFHPIHGPPSQVLHLMKTAICDGFYATFCTRFARNPLSKSQQKNLPRLILAPDRPVYKRNKLSLNDVTINQGLHYNGLLLIPPVSRCPDSAADLIAKNHDHYRKDGIDRIDVTPIDRNPGRIVDYTFKTVNRLKASWDDMIVLPRTIDEMTSSQIAPDPRERAIKNLQSALNLSDELAAALLDDQLGRKPDANRSRKN
jgi:hypothetical protein